MLIIDQDSYNKVELVYCKCSNSLSSCNAFGLASGENCVHLAHMVYGSGIFTAFSILGYGPHIAVMISIELMPSLTLSGVQFNH